MAWLAAWIASVVAGDAPANPSNHQLEVCGGQLTVVGSVEMAPDRTLVVRKKTSALVLRPEQETYRGYVDLVGGLQPGQGKPLHRGAGWVWMNEDRSLG